ncbi:alpha/beta fold hydrolase [Robiginitalea sp. SC105]|uniref:alpha/beta fold hydrolase n=1 Tax=Robiginitalea sp. SC105 TaxID=2762332 RepID=UPI00163A5AF7|nr:alpha/beta hydrolase [Robiginitalea sp. SC105]MBC2840055.1 alpha/beta fold hydrolase [Robiginitalea sp. SC105]
MINTRQITVKDLQFDCLVAGDPDHEAVLLLHGFPETSFMWRRLMAALVSRGYYCIAPNMRGYSPNACPKGVSAYRIGNLRQDVLDIAVAFGREKFHLIGHDWGAAIGWHVTGHHPDRILSWTALSVPHNRAFSKAFRQDPDQKKRSGYIRWFLMPWVPEMMIRKKDFRKFRQLWKRSAPEEVENYLSVFRRRESLTAALNYYRANIGRGKNEPLGDITVPTLFIWGKKDVAIGAFAAESNAGYMKGDYTFLPLDGGHWLVQGNYGEVEAAVLGHLQQYGQLD